MDILPHIVAKLSLRIFLSVNSPSLLRYIATDIPAFAQLWRHISEGYGIVLSLAHNDDSL